ncbi:MAG: glycosyltransferase family 4 protein [Sphingomonadales bacterium]|nr:glycosyltransferase family 4 protein [Sphingomonadales bacterium]MDE2171453.1 glycosyltransferase family 4 protein [Sphingomonadales bacterium]
MAMTGLLINGRFLSRPATGVDRTASELVRALERRRQAGAPFTLSIAVPADGPADEEIRRRLALGQDCAIHRSHFRGYAWEQLVLAFVARRDSLVSLCNMGPVLRRRQLVLIHDTQVHDVPESYNRAFRLTYRLLQPWLARRAQSIATVSQHSAQRLQHHGIGGARHFAVLPNGIDHFDAIAADEAILPRLGLMPGGYLLAIGAKARHKNIAMLIAAYRAWSGHKPPLVLVGAPWPEIEQNAPDLIWTDRVSDGELKALYSGARLFLLPSLTEGFGLPALEAMACGCPVLTSHAGALSECCGDAAAYCAPDDAPGWTATMVQLADQPQKLATMRKAGLAQAALFRWDVTAALMLRLLDETALSAPGAQPDICLAQG